METFSTLPALCAEHSPVTGEFPAQRPVTWSFDVFFDLRQNKQLSKQSWGWWFEMPSCSLWCHCNTQNSQTPLPSMATSSNTTTVCWILVRWLRCAGLEHAIFPIIYDHSLDRLCFIYIIIIVGFMWSICTYSSGLPHWHWDKKCPGASEVTIKDMGKSVRTKLQRNPGNWLHIFVSTESLGTI